MAEEDYGGEVSNFAERAELTKLRDRFLALSPRNRVSHGIREGGEHGIALLYCHNEIEALSFRAEGDSYWTALRLALEKLPPTGQGGQG